MRLHTSFALCLLTASLSSALPAPQDGGPVTTTTLPDGATTTLPVAASTNTAVAADQIDQLAAFAQTLANQTLESSSKKQKRGLCTPFNLAVRREWGSLSPAERKDYTRAVKCLIAKGAKTPTSIVPGVRSRFDDWVASHVNQTMNIHYTGTFLAWHRYFTWQYEQALRNECGYKGYQPYWDWAKTAASGLEKSPIFDGSDTSMSGNGLPVPGQQDIILGGNGLPEIRLPVGTGGGAVTKGPFAGMQVNLGPVSLSLPGGATGNNGDGLAFNPRPLKRDLTDAINRRYANATGIAKLVLTSFDIETFQMTMQGVPGTGDIGVHGGGHYSIGGDPGRDFFTSPGDPVFYLHHAQIDRIWWIWQALSPISRTGASGISGTNTFLNQPPSDATTLQTPVDMFYATAEGAPGGKKMADLMSTISGPFCYIYL